MPKVPQIRVEIVAKAKGCMLCDLALAMLEAIEPEFTDVTLTWAVVDVGSRDGLARQAELGKICGRTPTVPSLVINNQIAFDNIPEMDELITAIRSAVGAI
jgi:glutaredoxin